jgi:hypothetical protein
MLFELSYSAQNLHQSDTTKNHAKKEYQKVKPIYAYCNKVKKPKINFFPREAFLHFSICTMHFAFNCSKSTRF